MCTNCPENSIFFLNVYYFNLKVTLNISFSFLYIVMKIIQTFILGTSVQNRLFAEGKSSIIQLEERVLKVCAEFEKIPLNKVLK